MKKFPDYEMDYTLLVLENITTNKSIYDFWKRIDIDDALELNLELFAREIFNTSDENLKFALRSIKSLKEEL